MDDPMKALHRLEAAVNRISKPLGINLTGFQVTLTDKSVDDIISLEFEVEPETVVGEETIEQKKYDMMFEDIADSINLCQPSTENIKLEEWDE